MTAGNTDPQPVLSAALAAQLLSSPWPVVDGDPSSVDPHRRVVELAVTVVGSVTDASVPEPVTDTLDLAGYALAAGDSEAVAVVTETFVPALLCVASHRADDPELLVRHLPAELWQRWHQVHQELEAASLSADLAAEPGRRPPMPGTLESALVYRAENGRLVPRVGPVADPEPRTVVRLLSSRVVTALLSLLILAAVVIALR